MTRQLNPSNMVKMPNRISISPESERKVRYLVPLARSFVAFGYGLDCRTPRPWSCWTNIAQRLSTFLPVELNISPSRFEGQLNQDTSQSRSITSFLFR
jgi:hypothetical protein